MVEGSAYPDTWSDTENVLWKTPVPGIGHSSPIVWGNQIFLTTGYDGGTRNDAAEFRSWGAESMGGRPPFPSTAASTSTPRTATLRATPVTDGELVFASFGHQGMMAVDFDGNLVWHNKIEDLSNYHGSAGSPVLYEDEVIIYQDQGGASFVAAFDKRTGDVVWRTKRDAGVGWERRSSSTPVSATS